MTPELVDLIWALALGVLEGDERARALSALEQVPGAKEELAHAERTLAEAAIEMVLPEGPDAQVRARLMDSVATGVSRWSPFIDKVAEFLDVNAERAAAVLSLIDKVGAWGPSLMPRMEQIDVDRGPRLVAVSDVGLVRLPAGFHFPKHRHGALERVMPLQGSFTILETGQRFGPGEVAEASPQVVHQFKVSEDSELIFLAAIWAPIEVVEDAK